MLLADAVPVVGDQVGVEARAAVADEDLDPGAGGLGVDVDAARTRVLGRVRHRLACGEHQRAVLVGHRRVTHADHLDRDAVRVLDLGGHRTQRGRERVGSLAVAVEEPGPQVALLGAGEPRDRRRVAGRALDQGQGLQHRVVQVRGDVGPLLRAHPGLALLAEVGGQPEQPRTHHEPEPEDAERCRQAHVERRP